MPFHVGYVYSVGQINFEKLFYFGFAAVGTAFAIAFVYQEFMIVDRKDFTCSGAGGRKIRVLFRFCRSGGRCLLVGEDFLRLRLGGILNQRLLHDWYQAFSIWSDAQTFHTFVGYVAGSVVVYFELAHGREDRGEQFMPIFVIIGLY